MSSPSDYFQPYYQSLAMTGLFGMFVTLGCMVLVWVLLQEVSWEKLLRQPTHPRARLLQLMVAVAIGYLFARFLLDYWEWAGAIKWLFRAG